jgi:hypothetical protein
LAGGVLVRAPWLVQPLLAAWLTFLILGHLEKRVGSHSVRVASSLLTLCLFYAYYGASYRPHLATALCVFGAFLAHERSRERPDHGVWWIALAGILLGMSALMRYTDWIPLGLWIAFSLARAGRRRDLLILVAGFALLASVNLAYGWLLSGRLLVVPTHLGGDVGAHDRLRVSWDGLKMTAARLALLCGVFPPVVLLARYWTRARAALLDQRSLLILFVLNAGIYSLFSAAVGGPGPRYYFSYFPFLVIAVVALYERVIRGGAAGGRRLWQIVVAAQVVASVIFVAREAYTLYWRRDVERTIAEMSATDTHQRIVLLTTGTYRTDVTDLTMNPPTLASADTLYLAHCDPRDVETLEERFADRERFMYAFPGDLFRSAR